MAESGPAGPGPGPPAAAALRVLHYGSTQAAAHFKFKFKLKLPVMPVTSSLKQQVGRLTFGNLRPGHWQEAPRHTGSGARASVSDS